MTLILGLALIAAALVFAYMAGADRADRARWQDDATAAEQARILAASRERHPGGRDL